MMGPSDTLSSPRKNADSMASPKSLSSNVKLSSTLKRAIIRQASVQRTRSASGKRVVSITSNVSKIPLPLSPSRATLARLSKATKVTKHTEKVLSVMTLPGAAPAEPWITHGGYMEWDGNYVGVTAKHHDELMETMRMEYDEEIAELLSQRKEEVLDFTKRLSKAVMKARVVQRARVAGQEKIKDLNKTIAWYSHALTSIEPQVKKLVDELKQSEDRATIQTTMAEQNLQGMKQFKRLLEDVRANNQYQASLLQHQVNELQYTNGRATLAVRNLTEQLDTVEATCEQQVAQIQEAAVTIHDLRSRFWYAKEEVNRLARKDLYCKQLESSNRSQARRVREFQRENSTMKSKIAEIEQQNLLLKARVTDLENLPPGGQFTPSNGSTTLAKENARLVQQAHNHRIRMAKMQLIIDQQADKISDLQDDNDWLDSKALKAADRQITLEQEVSSLRPLAASASKNQQRAETLEQDLLTNWLALAPSAGPFGQIIHKLHARAQELVGENKTLRDANTQLELVADEHRGCEKTVWKCQMAYDFQEKMTAALHKQNNHAIEQYNRLRVQAGLESTAPPTAIVGLEKVHLNAMFEAMCRRRGVEYTDEMRRFAVEQDMVTLAQAEAVGKEGQGLIGEELTAREKVMFSVVENMIEKFKQLLVDKTEVFGGLGRPLHPVIRAEAFRIEEDSGYETTEDPFQEVDTGIVVKDFAEDHEPIGLGVTGVSMPKFANTEELLGEVRAESQLRASSSSPADASEEQLTKESHARFASTNDLLAEVRVENQLRNSNSSHEEDVAEKNVAYDDYFEITKRITKKNNTDITEWDTEKDIEVMSEDVLEKSFGEEASANNVADEMLAGEEQLKLEVDHQELQSRNGMEDELKNKLLEYAIAKLGKGVFTMENDGPEKIDENEYEQEDMGFFERIRFMVGLGVFKNF